ncbi:hypothetical protein SEEHN189_20436, partial [Salmonella enterica subsp. enterica serovar Heidelberg str. N189]
DAQYCINREKHQTLKSLMHAVIPATNGSG